MQEAKTEQPRWIGGVEPPAELLKATGTEVLEYECREQPGKLRGLIETYRTDATIQASFARFREAVKRPGPVLFIGMGASYCASFSASTLLQTQGRLAFSVDAGEWLHYAGQTWKDISTSVLLTASGESAELVALFKDDAVQAPGLICNNTNSTCWNLAKNRLPIMAGPEYGNATKTYTNTCAAAIILASEMLGLPWQEDAERVLSVYEGDLNRLFAERSKLEEFCRGAANIEIIGRGAGYGSAIMSALCVREMSGFRAAPHTGAGFKHGPNLDIDGTHVAIIYAVGRAAELGFKLSDECIRRGGKVVLVSNEDREASERLLPVKIAEVPEPWESISTQPVAQALTMAWIERNGCRLPPRFQYGKMEQ